MGRSGEGEGGFSWHAAGFQKLLQNQFFCTMGLRSRRFRAISDGCVNDSNAKCEMRSTIEIGVESTGSESYRARFWNRF